MAPYEDSSRNHTLIVGGLHQEIVDHVYALLDDGTFDGRYAALQAQLTSYWNSGEVIDL